MIYESEIIRDRIKQQIAFISENDCEVSEAGSRVTCNPAPNTDYDFLVFAPNKEALKNLVYNLPKQGFGMEGDESYHMIDGDSPFASWRVTQFDDAGIPMYEINLIVTKDEKFWMRHKAATAVSKKLNILNKEDRIMLFQAVLYGEIYTPDQIPF